MIIPKYFISKRQYGFSIGRSTMTKFFEYSNFIAQALEVGEITDSIYMDFCKVFDRLK